MRRDTHRAIATDAEGHELRINDNVKEVDGEVRLTTNVHEWWLKQIHRVGKDASYICTSLSTPSYSIETMLKTLASS